MDDDTRLLEVERQLAQQKEASHNLNQHFEDMQSTLERIESMFRGTTHPDPPPPPPPPPPPDTPDPLDADSATAKSQSHRLKPAAPSDFDGDRANGRNFLNSCRLYIKLLPEHFRSDQDKIQWALSTALPVQLHF
ncbi:hypothetical protein HGRIS_005259 [Hohenbuehelia grisea]|uniref:Uncharacterized protein n=1 Tax=Hohenbuehelia grisea TaxID=104357 RepID=A0ABR3JFG0_9AGAR